MRRVLLLLCTVSCAATPRPASDREIYAWEVARPDGARAGMFMTWRHETSHPGPTDVVEETVACVAPDTMEWRETRRDGTATVVAARYGPDGALLGAWEGPRGGVGRPLGVVAGRADAEEAEREARRLAAELGISTEDARAEREVVEEEIETPAGRFRCIRDRTRVSLLFASGTMTTWLAREPLPLDRLVRYEEKGPLSLRTVQELVAYGSTGARPTLTVSPAPTPR